MALGEVRDDGAAVGHRELLSGVEARSDDDPFGFQSAGFARPHQPEPLAGRREDAAFLRAHRGQRAAGQAGAAQAGDAGDPIGQAEDAGAVELDHRGTERRIEAGHRGQRRAAAQIALGEARRLQGGHAQPQRCLMPVERPDTHPVGPVGALLQRHLQMGVAVDRRADRPPAVRAWASTERPRLSLERAATSRRSAFGLTVNGRSRTSLPSCRLPWYGRPSDACSTSAACAWRRARHRSSPPPDRPAGCRNPARGAGR